jgi:hypothetical protein
MAVVGGVTLAGVGTAHALRRARATVPVAQARPPVQLPWWPPDPLRINGATGYYTFTGPLGRPLAVGRPWGKRCQPIRFTANANVPYDVYQQIVAVVHEARAVGIDVTVESRTFWWQPESLHYPAGMTPSDVKRVPFFAHFTPAPTLSNGRPERVGLGWDASADPDGHHEDITYAQAILQMSVLAGDRLAQRRAVRQAIAMTQGIMRTSRTDSGIRSGTTVDAFSSLDIAAMRLMSGCGTAALPH